MNIVTVKKTKIGREPVVVLPLKQWERIADALEDLEALSSQNFRKSIVRARKEAASGHVVGLEELLGGGS